MAKETVLAGIPMSPFMPPEISATRTFVQHDSRMLMDKAPGVARSLLGQRSQRTVYHNEEH
jgi:hypothetical protein